MTQPNIKAAKAAGKAAARADRRAGGFANACDGTGHDMTEDEEAAFNAAYRRAAPRRWYR
jgi:hypothetical protein